MTLGLQAWQWGVLLAAYVLLFVLPALWMYRRAKRDGDSALAWAFLVLVTSGLGVVEYRKHRRILAKRAARAQKAKSAEADAPPGAGR